MVLITEFGSTSALLLLGDKVHQKAHEVEQRKCWMPSPDPTFFWVKSKCLLCSSAAVLFFFFVLSFDFLPQTHGLLVRGGTGGESGMGTLQVGPELRPCVPCLEHGHRHITGTRCFIQGKHSVCYSFFHLLILLLTHSVLCLPPALLLFQRFWTNTVFVSGFLQRCILPAIATTCVRANIINAHI